MTQPYEYDDEDFDETDDDEDSKPARTDQEWAELRRARKARDKALKELEGFKREKAFNKAGIDPDDPKFAYFVKGYEGDITPEAIRAEALKAGFLEEQAEPEPDDSALHAQNRVQQAAGDISNPADIDTAALDSSFAEGGVDGMMQYLASRGIPLNVEQ